LACDPLAGRRAYGSVRWQTLCSPAGDAILEIDCIDPRCAEFGRQALAELAPMNAVRDHLATARQLFSPLLHLVRITMVGRDDELPRGGKIGETANVNDGRCRGSSEPTIKLSRRDRRESSLHDIPIA